MQATQSGNNPQTAQHPADQEEPFLDVATAALLVRYGFNSLRRHKWLLVFVFVGVAGLAAVANLVLPKKYEIRARILTNRSYVMPALVHPRRSVPLAADAPTRGAPELVFARENLQQLLADVDLLTLIEQNRSPLLRLKDRIRQALFGPVPEAELRDALVNYLGEQIRVDVDGDVVSLSVTWKQPLIALRLSEAMVNRFLATRRDMELREIVETVQILERNTGVARDRIGEVVKQVEAVVKDREAGLKSRQVAARRAARRTAREQAVQAAAQAQTEPAIEAMPQLFAIRRPNAADASSSRDRDALALQQELQSTQATVESIKRDHERRVQSMQERLANMRVQLGPDHPDVLQAMRDLENERRPPAELAALETEETRLAERHRKALVEGATQVADDAFEMVRMHVSDDLATLLASDAEFQQIMAEVRKRQADYDDVMARLSNARIELETVNAAFGLRYQVTQPPLFPKKPSSPKPKLIIAAGIVGGMCLAVFLALCADILSMRVLETWQIDRFVGLRVLGEVEQP